MGQQALESALIGNRILLSGNQRGKVLWRNHFRQLGKSAVGFVLVANDVLVQQRAMPLDYLT